MLLNKDICSIELKQYQKQNKMDNNQHHIKLDTGTPTSPQTKTKIQLTITLLTKRNMNITLTT